MTIANTTSGVWVNSDGLRVKFPPESVRKTNSGEFRANTSTHITEFDINYQMAALGTSATTVYILDYDTVFPKTSVIEKIEFVTGTAWATDTSISIGTVRHSDFTTIIDADGLVDALILAARDLAGETTVILPGGTYSGVLLGAQGLDTTYDAVLSVCFESGSAPTAGTGTLRVYWRNGVPTVSPLTV
jgi:hypothetical protein